MRPRAGAALVFPSLLAVLVGLGLGAAPAAAAAGTAWSWPLAGPHEVSRPFAPPASRYGAGHRGADLPAEAGAGVRAAAAGRVSYAGLLGGRGVVVVVHGDLRTTYEPVTASVAVGSAVAAGTEIGRLEPGHAGCPVAACLHWGLRRGEDYLDPVGLVDRSPARLLPLGGAAAGSGTVGAGGTGVAVTPPDGAAGPVGPPDPAAVPAPPAAAPSEAETVEAGAQAWSLRAARAPAGLAAVAALALGVGLLARRRPGPGGPAGGSTGITGRVAAEPEQPVALVLQLDAERVRRRAG